MYNEMYRLTNDYMSNQYTVDEMCIRGGFCETDPKYLALVNKKNKKLAKKFPKRFKPKKKQKSR